MGAYGRFAQYYDMIYEPILDYDADCVYLERLFHKFLAVEPRSILDLGCGTGNHAIRLARRGYSVTGLDFSNAQLAVARRKARAAKLAVKFVRGDMARFDLDRVFDAAICMFGGFGYLLADRGVASHFASVRRHLGPGGAFVFEFWHLPASYDHHFSYIYRQKPIELIRLDESRTDRRRRLTMKFQFFALKGDRVLDRFTEVHVARLYTIPQMRRLITRAGFHLEALYGGTGTGKSMCAPTKATFRITAVATPAQ